MDRMKIHSHSPEVSSDQAAITPEIIENVMARVQDIDSKGIAYVALGVGEKEENGGETVWIGRLGTLRSVLQSGLLARERNMALEQAPPEEVTSHWAERARERPKHMTVLFNIVGRSDISEHKQPGSTEFEINHYTSKPGIITVLFDPSRFKEEEDRSITKPHHYSAAVPHGIDAEGQVIASSAKGFRMRYRVAPRWFRGIVIAPSGEGGDKQVMPARVEGVVNIMKQVCGNDTDSWLPIYDIHGNLLWPEKISRTELQTSASRQGEGAP